MIKDTESTFQYHFKSEVTGEYLSRKHIKHTYKNREKKGEEDKRYEYEIWNFTFSCPIISKSKHKHYMRFMHVLHIFLFFKQHPNSLLYIFSLD